MKMIAPRMQYAFSSYKEAENWVERLHQLHPNLNVYIEDPGWNTGEYRVVLRLNDALSDILGVERE